MQIVLDIKNENIINQLKEFINSFKNDIKVVNDNILEFININDIELLNETDEDYKTIEKIKSESNKKYSLDEARKILNDS